MKMSELGEFGLQERLAQIIPTGPGVVVGIGDDAAVFRADGLGLATTDSLVEGSHFSRAWASAEELGWKALAVNLSDIAAMGGVPRYALISLALPPDTEVEWVLELYEGLVEAAQLYQVAIVGGDLHRAPEVSINVTVLGTAQGAYLLRSAARPGDLVGVTGHLGSSAGGLRMLRQGLSLDAEASAYLRQAHLRPRPRIGEGQALLRLGVKAAIDISDGLVADLGHLCRLSRVRARITTSYLPLHPLLKRAFPGQAIALALTGGEDYELLFTAPHEAMLRARKNLPVTVIGELREGEGVEVVDERGQPFPLEREGWEHFAPGNRQPQP